MDCKQFQHWLIARDPNNKQIPPDISGHMENCRDCRLVFETDDLLEQRISAAFRQEEMPEGMARRISLSLDQKPTQNHKILPVLAALVAGLVLVVFIISNFNSPPAFESLDQISTQAAALHLKNKSQQTFGHEADQTLAMITLKLGFNIILPDPAQLESTITGCSLCNLGHCKVAYFTVERNGKQGSLFIMNKDDIEFPIIENTQFNQTVKGCETSVWINRDLVYAMVF